MLRNIPPRRPEERLSASIGRSILLFSVLIAVVGCTVGVTPNPASPAPTTSPIASPTVLPASPSPSATAAPTPTPPPSPTAVPGPTACASSIDAGNAPSDRLTTVKVEPGVGADKIVFSFGQTSGQPSGTVPTGELKPTAPPFTQGASGLPVTILGDRFVRITFRGMAITDDQGNPTDTGPYDFKPTAIAIREVYNAEAFEGVVTWIVGIAGSGCVSVERLGAPDRIVVTVNQL